MFYELPSSFIIYFKSAYFYEDNVNQNLDNPKSYDDNISTEILKVR